MEAFVLNSLTLSLSFWMQISRVYFSFAGREEEPREFSFAKNQGRAMEENSLLTRIGNAQNELFVGVFFF